MSISTGDADVYVVVVVVVVVVVLVVVVDDGGSGVIYTYSFIPFTDFLFYFIFLHSFNRLHYSFSYLLASFSFLSVMCKFCLKIFTVFTWCV